MTDLPMKRPPGRPRTGAVTKHRDPLAPGGFHYDVRITFPDGTRSNWRCLPVGTSFERAREVAAAGTERAIELAKAAAAEPPKPPAETWAGWADRWFTARDARKAHSAKDNRSHFSKWVPEELKAKTFVDVSREDLESIVEQLDNAVAADTISWKRATNVWGTVTKMFNDASKGKRRDLKVLATNPCAGVAGPDRGARKSKVYLFPVEFMAMMNCERIPIRWKRLFALSVYLYPRPGELEVLRLEDINLQHRFVFLHQASDRASENEKETKTGVSRHVPIEAPLLPLLEQMIVEAREREDERLLVMPPECDLSARLRQYLVWAGVTRAELLKGGKTRKRVTFYDLRATGITWMALRGDEPLKIQQRAGHEEFKTTAGYIRAAEDLAHAIGPADVFPALPASVVSAGVLAEGPAVWGLLRESAWKRGVPSGIRTPSQADDQSTNPVDQADPTPVPLPETCANDTANSANDRQQPKPAAETGGAYRHPGLARAALREDSETGRNLAVIRLLDEGLTLAVERAGDSDGFKAMEDLLDRLRVAAGGES